MLEVTLPWPPRVLSQLGRWTAAEDFALATWIAAGRQHAEIAAASGRGRSAIRNRAWRLRLVNEDRSWTHDEEAALRKLYEAAGANGLLGLDAFGALIGRDKANICRKAKELGLRMSSGRSSGRKDRRKFKGDTDALREHMSQSAKKRIAENGHPRGASGMKHTEEAKAKISQASLARWVQMTDDERERHVYKCAVGSRAAGGVPGANRASASWKAAWREVGGRRIYFRSRWEANYGRYLEWLKAGGHIAEWDHEPAVFWFDGIRRGCVSYLPDFKVTELDGTVRWHEVKGWMDARSATVLKRMAKYHPKETIVLIREKQYNEIKRKVSAMIPGWES